MEYSVLHILTHDILLPGGEKDEHGNIVTFVVPSINDYVKLSAQFYAFRMAIISLNENTPTSVVETRQLPW